ncbi:MAG: hypothetical protein U0T84_09300 [Chitinophagales bacterium]
MKRLISISLLAIAVCFQVKAQLPPVFPTERDKFPKALEEYLRSTHMENAMKAADDFAAAVKSAAITDGMLQQMAATANVMSQRQMTPNPYFTAFVNAAVGFGKNKVSAEQFANWSKVAQELAVNQRKGDNKDYQKFMEFSVAFANKGAMYATSSKMWLSDSKNYTLVYEGGKALLRYPSNMNLYGYTSSDTLVIKETRGDFSPAENKWIGRFGKLDWARNKLPASSVYALVKSDYNINYDNFQFSIDTVEFYYKDFFPTPLSGRYTNKFVADGDSTSSYPRFDSRGDAITLKDVVPHCSFTGNFGLWGNKVMGYGTPESKATVTFFKSDKSKVINARSLNFSIKKGEEISSPKAEVILFNSNDTIYHPELILTYKARNNEVRLLRGESGISKSKFFDSYHNYEFDVDAIFWNLDSPRMQLRTLNGVGQVGSNFESNNFFDKERIRKVQGVGSYEPLSIIKRQYEKTGSRELNSTDLAKAIDPHLTEEQCKSLYYQLVQDGFILYDEPTGIVTMRDKVLNYVMSNAKKIDYDILHLKSIPKDGVDYINLSQNAVELKGVKVIPISDTAGVVAFPNNNSVKLMKDRDMEFDGVIYGGRLDFFGKNYKFDYSPFTFDFTNLDSLRINIPLEGKYDEYGQPKLATLNTNIEGVKGLLEVDAPINKSGRSRLLQFPKLTSREKSYATYEDPHIGGGAYKRKDFYFELEPFKLDSLNAFTPSVINWKGKFVSGGIFPDIPQKLHIMPDLSLGFEITSDPAGLALYGTNGNYTGDIKLNHDGLSGSGHIKHLTADFDAKGIQFFPDSLKAVADTFHIAKTYDGVKTPEVSSAGNTIFWKTKRDSMMIYGVKDKAFSLYENQTEFKGNMVLTSGGLKGGGSLDSKEALVNSKEFNFKTEVMTADTAEMNIKSTSGDKVTFKTPNVKAYIDFKTHIGDFKSNLPNVPTDFAYNNFQTNIKEFKWYMEQKILDFKAPPGPGEEFVSTRAAQLGLKFLGKRATYNLQTAVLRVEQVPYILVADAKVIPDSGVVTIQGEARLDELKKATIVVDTITAKHKLENCNVNIISKAELKGSGTYKFSTKDHKDQLIQFDNISCQRESFEDKNKNKFTDWSLVAKGAPVDSDKFYIYPNVTYRGDVTLFGRNRDLFMKGAAQLHFNNPNAVTSDFRIAEDVNPDTLFLHYDSLTRNADNNKVAAGILVNRSQETPGAYVTLLAPMQNFNDPHILRTAGVVMQHPKTGEYLFGDEEKLKGGSLRGTVLRYNDAKGTFKGEGLMSLGADFGLLKSFAAGTVEGDLNTKNMLFNMTFGIDIRIDNKAFDEKLQTIMFNDNTDLSDINYETDRFKMIWNNLADKKADEKAFAAFETAPQFVRPAGLKHSFIFSDVNFVYDSVDVTLRSFGKIGLAFVGEKGIHKRLDGYIEIGLHPGQDYFNIYLKTGANEWFFFEYHPGNLGILSSYDDVNRMIASLPPDKRRVTGENNRFFSYNLGSSINRETFVEAMKEKVNPTMPAEKAYIKPKPAVKDSTAKVAPKPLTKDSTKASAPVVKDSTKTTTPAVKVAEPAKAPKDSAAAAPAPVAPEKTVTPAAPEKPAAVETPKDSSASAPAKEEKKKKKKKDEETAAPAEPSGTDAPPAEEPKPKEKKKKKEEEAAPGTDAPVKDAAPAEETKPKDNGKPKEEAAPANGTDANGAPAEEKPKEKKKKKKGSEEAPEP